MAAFFHTMRRRAFARHLGLKSAKEWRAYCASGKRPLNIPHIQKYSYAGKGWKTGATGSEPDFAEAIGDYLPYDEATRLRALPRPQKRKKNGALTASPANGRQHPGKPKYGLRGQRLDKLARLARNRTTQKQSRLSSIR